MKMGNLKRIIIVISGTLYFHIFFFEMLFAFERFAIHHLRFSVPFAQIISDLKVLWAIQSSFDSMRMI